MARTLPCILLLLAGSLACQDTEELQAITQKTQRIQTEADQAQAIADNFSEYQKENEQLRALVSKAIGRELPNPAPSLSPEIQSALEADEVRWINAPGVGHVSYDPKKMTLTETPGVDKSHYEAVLTAAPLDCLVRLQNLNEKLGWLRVTGARFSANSCTVSVALGFALAAESRPPKPAPLAVKMQDCGAFASPTKCKELSLKLAQSKQRLETLNKIIGQMKNMQDERKRLENFLEDRDLPPHISQALGAFRALLDPPLVSEATFEWNAREAAIHCRYLPGKTLEEAIRRLQALGSVGANENGSVLGVTLKHEERPPQPSK